MTKKLALCAFLILFLSGVAFAELEVGFGIAPPLGSTSDETSDDQTESDSESSSGGFFYDNTAVLHAGYSFAWLFYASLDAMMLPPSAVSSMTGYFNVDDGTYKNGVYRPGILSLIDVGIRPRIGPLMLMVTTGINNLYIYQQDELDEEFASSLGVNLRVGLGLKLSKWLGLMVSGTVVFSDFDSMIFTLKALEDPKLTEKATEQLLNNLYPVITLNLHL